MDHQHAMQILEAEIMRRKTEQYEAIDRMLKRPGDVECKDEANRAGGAVEALQCFRNKLLEAMNQS